MWYVLFVIAGLSLSLGQYQNDSMLNCTEINWSEINTTNYTELDDIFEQCLDRVSEYEDCRDPSLCEDSPSKDENIGLAFGLTAAAGLATTLGSLVPFIPCIKRSDTKYLAASLGLAAGVMLYVSFTEIFNKSQDQFCCVSSTHQNLLTTACFFVGILLTVALDGLVKLLGKIDCGCCSWKMSCRRPWKSRNVTILSSNGDINSNPPCNPMSAVSPLALAVNGGVANGGMVQFDEESTSVEPNNNRVYYEGNNFIQSSSNDESPSLHSRAEFVSGEPDNDRMFYNNMPNAEGMSISAASNTISTTTNNLGDASIQDLLSNTSIHRLHAVISESVSIMNEDQSHVSISFNEDGMSLRTQSIPNNSESHSNGEVHSRILEPTTNEQEENEDDPAVNDNSTEQIAKVLGVDYKRLRRMGILTGLAIALHNFPEGLATFIATLADPSLGIALAIAIALHNIPEGVCVAMPIYYATGSRLKAFFWAFLSGVSEPVGALLGWVILRNFFGPVIYGVSFGLIAGMMVYISLKELLPTAYKFDNTNGILVTIFLVIGMIIMSLSLVLFYY